VVSFMLVLFTLTESALDSHGMRGSVNLFSFVYLFIVIFVVYLTRPRVTRTVQCQTVGCLQIRQVCRRRRLWLTLR
jgi:hypothetical protein